MMDASRRRRLLLQLVVTAAAAAASFSSLGVSAAATSLNGFPITVVGTACTAGTYSCGAQTGGMDSINVCLGGSWAHLDACDQANAPACSILGGVPYCVASNALAAATTTTIANPPSPTPASPVGGQKAGTAGTGTTAAGSHTTADCQFANQFLCKTPCGKILIQCTGAGTGVELGALDEDAAVCNNGAIDFATNCEQPPPPPPAALLLPLPPAAAAVAATGTATTHTAADCQFANQFLCKVQCGKVLIQCTGAGTGAELQPLDEDAAVCNNGQIDFAQNCVTTAGTAGTTTTTTNTGAGTAAGTGVGGAKAGTANTGAGTGTAAGVTHTAADCQFANQFLCKPLDEDAAVCNNGQIDFAQNCVTTGGAGTGAPTTTTTTTAVGAGKGGVATVTTTSSAAAPAGTGTGGAGGLTLTGFPAIAVGTACTSGYACGGRNAAGEDSIVICTGGAYVKLDDCNDAPNVACSLINGQPFCVKP
ncbi:hypothetical protein DFJ73DRAFT_957614 [Zopfochytrium polystomum]|nr:hypothetical protein DFJ73DRAFT_957614 [Zopfochytrium polystomum]